MYFPDLAHRRRTVVIYYDVVRPLDLVLVRHLISHPVEHRLAAYAVALHDSGDARLYRSGHRYYLIDELVRTALEEYGSFHQHVFMVGILLDPLLEPRPDSGVDDGVELLQFDLVSEYYARQFFRVVRSKLFFNLYCTVDEHDLRLVVRGKYRYAEQQTERAADGRLARPDRTRDSYT